MAHVLAACGLVEAEPVGALRLSLGWTTTRADVDHLVRVLPEVVTRSRAASLVGRR